MAFINGITKFPNRRRLDSNAGPPGRQSCPNQQASNYRPMSFTSVTFKTLEHIIVHSNNEVPTPSTHPLLKLLNCEPQLDWWKRLSNFIEEWTRNTSMTIGVWVQCMGSPSASTVQMLEFAQNKGIGEDPVGYTFDWKVCLPYRIEVLITDSYSSTRMCTSITVYELPPSTMS